MRIVYTYQTSVSCDGCGKSETSNFENSYDPPDQTSYYKGQGWSELGNETLCPDCMGPHVKDVEVHMKRFHGRGKKKKLTI